MLELFLIIVIGIIAAIILSRIFHSNLMRRALWNKSPFPEAGGTGPLENLTVMEAGIVMSVDISRLLTMYLLDLVSFKDIGIVTDKPLKVEVLAEGDVPDFRGRFLKVVNPDGSLDPEKMMLALDYAYHELSKKILPFSVKETVIYYLNKVDGLWDSIQEERKTSSKLRTLEEQFPWLLLHEDAAEQLEQSFGTSARWPDVKPIVKLFRIIKSSILKDEELLRHAADHPEGIFSNKTYRQGILDWAIKTMRHLSYGETSVPVINLYSNSEEKNKKLNEQFEKTRKERTEKIERMKLLVDRIEGKNDNQ